MFWYLKTDVKILYAYGKKGSHRDISNNTMSRQTLALIKKLLKKNEILLKISFINNKWQEYLSKDVSHQGEKDY